MQPTNLTPKQIEERATSFVALLIQKQDFERALSFCDRDDLGPQLQTTLRERVQLAKKQLEDSKHHEAQLQQHLQNQKTKHDTASFGEIRSSISRQSWREALNLAETLHAAELQQAALRSIQDAMTLAKQALSDQFGSLFVMFDHGSALVLDSSQDFLNVSERLKQTRQLDSRLGGRNQRYNVYSFLSHNGGAQHLLNKTPEALVDFIQAFSWEGAPWWKPFDVEYAMEAFATQKVMDKQLFRQGEARAFNRVVGEHIEDALLDFEQEGEQTRARDRLEELFLSDNPAPAEDLEMEAMLLQDTATSQHRKTYAYFDALQDLDSFIFSRLHSDSVTWLNLVPDENENDAWVYHMLLTPSHVFVLGSFYEL